jgi:hypothetical protein
MALRDYFKGLLKSGIVDEQKSYDRGDGAMAQKRFAEGEREFRACVDEDPLDTQALLRLARAMELQHRHEDALRELGLARQKSIDKTDESDDNRKGWPSTRKDFRQHRILALTYAMGDLLIEKLEDAERARNLYANTLEELYGYPDVNPLRERLKRLEQPGQISISEAVEKAQPLKIPFPES